jgi:hypothetical protein
MAINNILNGELLSSIRSKLNSLINRINGDVSNYNQFIGEGSGDNNNVTGVGLEGRHNTFYGSRAGEENMTGYFCTFVGSRASELNTIGKENTALGAFTMRELVDGDQNTSIGAYSNNKNAYGSRNITIGTSSMELHVIGNYNTATGYQSQYSNVVAVRNSSHGYKTLKDNVFAFDNVAYGYKALQDLNSTNGQITDYSDNGDGTVTVTSVEHGLSNGETITIRGSGRWVEHSYSDNYDGQYTISNVTTDTFDITTSYVVESNLVTFGYWGKSQEATLNTALGFAAAINLATGSRNIAIGNNVNLDDPAGDNQINIGDTIKGSSGTNKWVEIQGGHGQSPLSSDPDDPDDGHYIQWISDGTGSGDAGDIMIKINVAGTVKIITLVDFSEQ